VRLRAFDSPIDGREARPVPGGGDRAAEEEAAIHLNCSTATIERQAGPLRIPHKARIRQGHGALDGSSNVHLGGVSDAIEGLCRPMPFPVHGLAEQDLPDVAAFA
jgi:hypothetical protein